MPSPVVEALSSSFSRNPEAWRAFGVRFERRSCGRRMMNHPTTPMAQIILLARRSTAVLFYPKGIK
ncbi:hypothetical protein BN961_00709 [Afipia felis]|uniref:Uncharacterized protein n=1 Tax=Afipia felis TaxID=1035 RepID=A0A090MIE3_AFIFE|nr:hypothetical protein BN961_00709 [Afipia felis]